MSISVIFYRDTINFTTSIMEKWRDEKGRLKKGNKINLGKKNALGKKKTDAVKKKMSLAMKGIPKSEEFKRAISKRKKGLKGSLSSGWRGGKSFEIYPVDWTDTLRESIRQRDEFICKICGIHQDELTGWYKILDVHHIDYDKLNCNPDNLVSLCRSCHMKTNDKNSIKWKNFFFGFKN